MNSVEYIKNRFDRVQNYVNSCLAYADELISSGSFMSVDVPLKLAVQSVASFDNRTRGLARDRTNLLMEKIKEEARQLGFGMEELQRRTA